MFDTILYTFSKIGHTVYEILQLVLEIISNKNMK